MPEFIPGLTLCRMYFHEVVAPILSARMPGLKYAAGRINAGSEVLGFDTAMSTDHGWGPSVQLFLTETDLRRLGPEIDQTLRRELPPTFMGWPTSAGEAGNAGKSAASVHRVVVTSAEAFFASYLAFDVHDEIEPADWLTFSEQKLRTIQHGAIYEDAVGLNATRSRFSYYPHDVWLYLMAAGWNRVGQEEHLMGRAGSVGDELGSAVIGSRLVRDLMHLCFLMERQFPPYPKWFGTAFRQLECADRLYPALMGAQTAGDWQNRENHLVAAYEAVAEMHNRLGITDTLSAQAGRFYERPFRVMHFGGGFAGALVAQIADAGIRQIADRRLIGSIDQWSDSTDILSWACWRPKLRAMYE